MTIQANQANTTNDSVIQSNRNFGISPNSRSFGAGPEAVNDACAVLFAAIIAVSLSVLATGYALGQYAAGTTFIATASTVGAGLVGSCVIAGIFLYIVSGK